MHNDGHQTDIINIKSCEELLNSVARPGGERKESAADEIST